MVRRKSKVEKLIIESSMKIEVENSDEQLTDIEYRRKLMEGYRDMFSPGVFEHIFPHLLHPKEMEEFKNSEHYLKLNEEVNLDNDI